MVRESQIRKSRMFLGYLDDSDSSENGLQGFQVIGGPVIHGEDYTLVENFLWSSAWSILGYPEQIDISEFHSAKLFHGAPPYNDIGIAKCRELFDCAVNTIVESKTPIVYGAVNKVALSQSEFQSSEPVDIAFRRYLKSLEYWMESEIEASWTGILICDDSGPKSANRKAITETFHQLRKKPKEMNFFSGPKSFRLLEDVYFGDSKHSTGIQLADVCAYLISCHLSGKPEQEPYFKKIDHLIHQHYLPDAFGI